MESDNINQSEILMKLRMESMNYFVKVQGVAISPRYDHRSEWLRMESNDELRNTAQSPG